MAETGVGDTSSPDGDGDFEPSAELLIHDYDDEGTMEEEENLSSDSGDNEELDDLQKESDMPLEDVLVMYGYGGPGQMPAGGNQESRGSTSEEEILNNHDLTLDKDEVARDVLVDGGADMSTVDELIENANPSVTSQLLNGSLGDEDGAFDMDEDDEDEDYLPTLDDEVWKKAIQIGEDFQANIPDLSSESTNNTSDSATTSEERLLWDPEVLSESEVAKYLNELIMNGIMQSSPDGMQGCVRDDEQALYTLLQSDFNVEEAVRRKKLQVIPPTDPLSLWSEDECQNFESGLRVYGKNFFLIHQNKVRTRSVGELVQFYYFWKKTERRETFCNRGRIEKKKPSVTPGITDYTDRFIDKPDSDDESTDSLTDCLCGPDEINSSREHHTTSQNNIDTLLHSAESKTFITPVSADGTPISVTPTSVSFSLNTLPTILPVSDITSSSPLKRFHPDVTASTTRQEIEYNNDSAVPTENGSKILRVEQVPYPSTATTEVGN